MRQHSGNFRCGTARTAFPKLHDGEVKNDVLFHSPRLHHAEVLAAILEPFHVFHHAIAIPQQFKSPLLRVDKNVNCPATSAFLDNEFRRN